MGAQLVTILLFLYIIVEQDTEACGHQFFSKERYFAYKTSETCFLCTFLNVNHNNLFSLHIPVFEKCYVDGFPSVVWKSETGCKLVTNLLKTEWNISTFFSVRVCKNSRIVELTSAFSFR